MMTFNFDSYDLGTFTQRHDTSSLVLDVQMLSRQLNASIGPSSETKKFGLRPRLICGTR